MKGAWIATIILLACSVSFGDHVSEWVSYQRVDERECCELRAEQPVWENERNLPGQLPDCHELYPWQELPDIEFDHHSDFARGLPDIEFDHHSDITREMPDLEFDGGWGTSPYAEVSMPEIQETSRGEPENGVGQARPTAQANPPVQARTPGQSRPPAELDGDPNEDTPRLASSRSEETSCRRPVTEAVGSPNLSRSRPPAGLDATSPTTLVSPPENGVGQARPTAQANPPVQARTPGQSRPPAELDGDPNEDTPRLASSRSEETSCRRPVTEAVGSPNLSRSKPSVVLDHSSDDYALAWPNIEFDGGDEAKSLPPKLAW